VSGVEQSQRDWLVEQRCRAVLEVLGGSRVSEVALRYGVSRQAVYAWKAKHSANGMDGLREASRRPKSSPTRVPAEVEAVVCEMRRPHPRWGARRIAFELGRTAVAAPSRATVHRILERNGLVVAQEQQHRRKYKRWQREAPMHLWQLDLVGAIYLADGRECKMLTGIDDHPRFVVIAAVLAVPSGRAVADAFLAAMRVHGVPAEVLTDNGKQFTGRFTKGRAAEVLFERVCRENGITGKLTRPLLTDHDREDRTLASDVAPGIARCRRPVRGPAHGAGGDQRLGARLQPRKAAPGAGHGDPGQPV
jgi:transposase